MKKFKFKETIKAGNGYRVFNTHTLLEKTKDNNLGFHDLVLMQTTDFTDVVLLDGGQFVMAAQLKSFEEFKADCLEGNEGFTLLEMFVTRKGNKYIYWKDDETDEDFLTKYEV